MKSIFLFSFLFIFFKFCAAQTNTFPSSGNVGIGTTSPSAKLDVNGTGSFAGNVTAPSFTGNFEGTANNASKWGDQLYGGVSSYTGIDYFYGYKGSTATAYLLGKNDMQIALGIPYGGETLQSITDRGQITNKIIQVTGSDVISSLGKGLTFNFVPSLNAGFIGAYDYPNAVPLPLVLQGNGGNVGIGTVSPIEKLSVNGKIRAMEIKVETANWPDFVFAKSYQLPSLQEIEKHIKEIGHLPGIPSAAEVKSDGIGLGEMNGKLLQKIEELTLYLIEQDKINKEQNQIILKLIKRIDTQKNK